MNNETHGRLIDADKLFEQVGNIKPINKQHYKDIGDFMNMITNAPTIVDADIERTFHLEERASVLEEKVRVANHRIEDLEHEKTQHD